MAESLLTQIDKLRRSIQGLESQRQVLGDEIINPAMEVLQQQLASLEQQSAAQSAPSDERRMVTILFIDMVGSTAIAEKMDPEEWRKIVSQLHTTLSEAITSHHGSVAQYLGDGLLAFFGSKETSEHDPENAIRAALDAQAAVHQLTVPEKIQIRAGIHSGLVVTGELGDEIHREFTASGDAMNLAARLQSAAPAGGTLISQDTYRYVRGVFDMTPMPPLSVKGKGDALQTYLVRRAKPRPFRSVSRGVAGVEARTVGRDAEIESLQKAYLLAYEGQNAVWAQLVGDPGVGKSRLMVDITDWLDLRDESFRLLRARAFPDDASQPFALVRRVWFDRFQIAEDSPLESAEAKWVERFKELYVQDDYQEQAHALGLLVGLPFKDSPFIKAMRDDPNQVKGRALVVSRELIRSIRTNDPLVVLLEDLQWTDAASWEYLMNVFLDGTVDIQRNGMFILGTARPEWQPPVKLEELFKNPTATENSSQTLGILINLEPLSNQSIRLLAHELMQGAADVPEDVFDLLVERSEGVPYFTEEIVNWFIDHEILDTRGETWLFQSENLKAQPLPATLQHLLLTRLSTLSQVERSALQRGAIFGRRFWSGGVEALGVMEGDETLGHLQPRGFVEAQPESAFEGDTEWSFHHNLLQEVTYESVLKRERSELHKVAAGWLEKQARQANRLEEFAGLLGDHCERAGELGMAASWYLVAGKRAMNQGAPREASIYYTRALDLLPPVDRERRWQTLLGREAALSVLGKAEPWKADIDSLLELAHTFEDGNYLAEAYNRQAIFGVHSGDLLIMDQAAQNAWNASRQCGNEAIEARAMIILAIVEIHRNNTSTALERIDQALQLARNQGDKAALAFVLGRAAYCFSEMGEFARFEPVQREQIELDHHLGNRTQEAVGSGNLGAYYLGLGQYKMARSLIEQANKIDEALDARRPMAYNLLNLGEIYMNMGDLRKAIQLTEQALQVAASTPDNRLKTAICISLGIELIAMGNISGALRRFTEALELTAINGYASLACETAVGLAVCAIMEGKPDIAREHIQKAWNYVQENGWIGMGNPGWIFRNIAETFDALNDPVTMHEVLDYCYRGMIELADKIKIPENRKSFLENVPENRALLEMWERNRR